MKAPFGTFLGQKRCRPGMGILQAALFSIILGDSGRFYAVLGALRRVRRFLNGFEAICGAIWGKFAPFGVVFAPEQQKWENMAKRGRLILRCGAADGGGRSAGGNPQIGRGRGCGDAPSVRKRLRFTSLPLGGGWHAKRDGRRARQKGARRCNAVADFTYAFSSTAYGGALLAAARSRSGGSLYTISGKSGTLPKIWSLRVGA